MSNSRRRPSYWVINQCKMMSYPIGRCNGQEVEVAPSPVLIYGVCQHARAGAEQFPDLLYIPLQDGLPVRLRCSAISH